MTKSSRHARRINRKEFNARWRLGEFRERWQHAMGMVRVSKVEVTQAVHYDENAAYSVRYGCRALHLIDYKHSKMTHRDEAMPVTVCGKPLKRDRGVCPENPPMGVCHACIGCAMDLLRSEVPCRH